MPHHQKTHVKSCPEYEKELNQIRSDVAPYLDRVDQNDFTWRDVAVLMEGLQRFGEVMDEMIDNPPPIFTNPNSDEIADSIMEATDG